MSQTVKNAEQRPTDLELKVAADRVCRGDIVKPRLFQVENHDGLSIPVAAWYCPSCDEFSAEYASDVQSGDNGS